MEPAARNQWVVLPQGMANSPTICQMYVAQALAPVHARFPQMHIIHYMDDILLAAETEDMVRQAYATLHTTLEMNGLIIAPDKVQEKYPYQYLGHTISETGIRPPKLTINCTSLRTLHDWQ